MTPSQSGREERLERIQELIGLVGGSDRTLPAIIAFLEQFMGDAEIKTGPPPASKKFIANLDTITVKEGSCSICMEDYVPGKDVVKKLPCGHDFGATCVKTWLEVNNTCPMCRKEYV
jgi:E3 ubiquitin-protein ligase AIP2